MKRCRSCGKPRPRALFDGMCGECADEFYALHTMRRPRKPSRLRTVLRRILMHGDTR